MALPSRDVPPSELFQKLMEAPAPSEVVEYPRVDANGKTIGNIRIRVLSESDHTRARVAAQKRMKRFEMNAEDMRGELMKAVEGDQAAKEVLAMACLTEHPAPGSDEDRPLYGRIFRSAEDVEKLPADDVAFLFNAYCQVQYKYGPFEKTVSTPAELNAWIKRLGEGAAEFPLLQLNLPALVELASLLAARAYTLSATLESQWLSLPDSLKSDLADYSMGTGFYGKPAAESTDTGGESLDE